MKKDENNKAMGSNKIIDEKGKNGRTQNYSKKLRMRS